MRETNHLFAKLQSGVAQLGLEISDENLRKLICYIEILLKWNKVFNLTAITEPDAIITHHILDSLSIVPYIHGTRMLDVGSGAGFPGVPCAIAVSQLKVVLLDSNGKKTRFLTQLIAQLKITNAVVMQSRIEDYQDQACFDTIVTRAFSSVANIFRHTQRLLCPDGELLIMKGIYPFAELQKSVNHAKVYPLSVPFLNEQRHLVCIRVNNESGHIDC